MAQDLIHIGCAGWSLPHALQSRFSAEGSHLERYASRLHACEINSSFYRPHGVDTYRRWADSVPEGFRFSVKLPEAITHERRLAGCEAALDEFLGQAAGLGDKLSCLLVQLPPSLALDARAAADFLTALRERWAKGIAVEPRHASWFTQAGDALLKRHRVARVLADPVRHTGGAMPGGTPQLAYLRLHGSPRTYYSAYAPELIAALARRIEHARQCGTEVWCIFDNTASGAAADNALALQQAIQQDPS
ncbi:DUF72 domain-containing protein [Caenimonas aquaedulcis]|uniref:DUF72 domain-containing protein n=1 Tax=Caenimonas aquaedulcis TaxID=2793270 RepID=A0A931MH91_9BURK|nr:DUF72 domain-containing protein [Caenimonas aquaedulcis]MBG9388742.1 DUF72 domain-containing protein [Caenimonas aquaedulcis]